ncbi:MAG: hypothetical protein U5J63_13015 [Fodinibius sp.]|nr:hypothetical protein [Fodinibius sp.]
MAKSERIILQKVDFFAELGPIEKVIFRLLIIQFQTFAYQIVDETLIVFKTGASWLAASMVGSPPTVFCNSSRASTCGLFFRQQIRQIGIDIDA